jgi:hypothetical protein
VPLLSTGEGALLLLRDGGGRYEYSVGLRKGRKNDFSTFAVASVINMG